MSGVYSLDAHLRCVRPISWPVAAINRNISLCPGVTSVGEWPSWSIPVTGPGNVKKLLDYPESAGEITAAGYCRS